MLTKAEWEQLVSAVQDGSSAMFFEAQMDGNKPPFSIEATDGDGNIIATVLFEGDGKRGIASIELKFNQKDFLPVPIFLTLRTMKGTIKRAVA